MLRPLNRAGIAQGSIDTAAGAVDSGLRAYMLRVYGYMSGALAVTGVVALFAVSSGLYQTLVSTPLFWIVVFAPLALVFFLSFRIDAISTGMAQAVFWAYAALMGLSLGGVFLVYTGESIARTFFIAAGTFSGMSIYGYTTRADLTRFGSFLMMGLWGLIIASVVSVLWGSSALQCGIYVVGVLVFVGLTAYATQSLKELYCRWNSGWQPQDSHHWRPSALSRLHQPVPDAPAPLWSAPELNRPSAVVDG